MSLKAMNLGFHYEQGPWLFRGLDLEVQPGEIVGLYGASGTGKTSLARILAGYEQPQEGRVWLNDQPLSSRGYQPVQLMWQHPEQAVNPRWRMYDILREAGEIDLALIQSLEIEDSWLRRWPHELSGGELQRFCVARALGQGTQYLIADEMTTMLDAITQAQIWQAVVTYAQVHQIGMLIISHERVLLNRLCTRVFSFT